ncbi:MAG: hypothetical protein HKM02_02875 [Pseudomonadales bacterium]|nr:hypothetical protein [Pseudomonadales bacterium]
MKNTFIYLLLIIGSCCDYTWADNGLGLDPSLIPGVLFSAGRSDTTRDGGLGSGFFLDTNYARTFVNVGVAYKDFTHEKTANAYAGIGFANILQLQAGYGSKGAVQRLRHDFNMTELYDFFTGNHRSPYSLTLENRISFTFAIERYNAHPEMDNASIGFGLLY